MPTLISPGELRGACLISPGELCVACLILRGSCVDETVGLGVAPHAARAEIRRRRVCMLGARSACRAPSTGNLRFESFQIR